MKEISLEEFKAILDKGLPKKQKIFDARRPDEFKAAHIQDAENISYDTVSSHLQTFQDSDKIYYYCSAGKRCKLACETLEKEGIDSNKLVHIRGMAEDWEKVGLPVVKCPGTTK